MDEQNNELSVINYRLTAIENEIKSLKDLLITVPLIDNRISNLEKRIDACETNNDLLAKELTKVKSDFNEVKNAPTKKAAARWEHILDYIFKGLVIIAIGYLFIPFGG